MVKSNVTSKSGHFKIIGCISWRTELPYGFLKTMQVIEMPEKIIFQHLNPVPLLSVSTSQDPQIDNPSTSNAILRNSAAFRWPAGLTSLLPPLLGLWYYSLLWQATKDWTNHSFVWKKNKTKQKNNLLSKCCCTFTLFCFDSVFEFYDDDYYCSSVVLYFLLCWNSDLLYVWLQFGSVFCLGFKRIYDFSVTHSSRKNSRTTFQ